MNTILIEVSRGTDSKLYPARPLPREQLNRARQLAHNLICRDRLSIRAAQRVMAGSYGLRRSVGVIARDLALFECPRCAGRPAREPTVPARVRQNRLGGSLTGQVSDG